MMMMEATRAAAAAAAAAVAAATSTSTIAKWNEKATMLIEACQYDEALELLHFALRSLQVHQDRRVVASAKMTTMIDGSQLSLCHLYRML